ncbi:MAG: enoyl-CoA hydratase-related protein [Gammaproteobacteria bacterium]|nr:enoyl-CoA hydratase-related protein [Gammaproteobacteria bacterium]
MEQDSLLFSRDSGIARVTLNRPGQRNALTVEMVQRLHDIWEEVDRDPEVRVVILDAAECGTFCAGMDLKEAARIKQESGQDVLGLLKDPFHERMRAVTKPVIGALSGHLIAGGMMLALNCDLRVGQVGSRIGITESQLGRGSPWAVPLLWMLPQAVVSELILTGEVQPIERYQALGFINYLESGPQAVQARALTLAERIRDNAPLSVMAGKASIRAAVNLGCAAGVAEAKRIYEAVYSSEDAQEGPRAFAEKRRPRWQGR